MTPVTIGAVVLVGVLVLVGVGIAVRRRRPSRIDTPEAAARAVERTIPGFAIAGAVVGADGAGALAVSTDNRVAAVAPSGQRILAREIGWSAVRATATGIVIETGDRRLRQVALAGVDILDIRRLAPASTSTSTSGPSPAALGSRGIAVGEGPADIATQDKVSLDRVP